MKRGGMPDEPWLAMTSRAADIVLEDADGKRMTVNGWSGSGMGEDYKFSAHYTRNRFNPFVGGGPARPQRVGEPKKLVWDVPTKIRKVSVPVEFRDLPMP